MARNVVQTVTYIDDMDGSAFAEGEGTAYDLSLSINGEVHRYTLDLGAKNAAAFAKAMAPWLERAHEVAPRVSGNAKTNGDAHHIRSYAAENGVQVSTQGRLSAAAKTAWEDAGKPQYDAEGKRITA